MMVGVDSVIPLDDYFLEVRFENGEKKYIDYKPFLSRGGLVSQLNKKEAFKKVSVLPEGEGIEWANGVDMSCFDLYELGVDELPEPHVGVACNKVNQQIVAALKKIVAEKG